MSTPERIQLRRTRGWRMPPDTVKVDRTTIFGNPFTAEKYGHDRALAMFRAWLGGTLSDNGLPDWALGRLLERRGLVLEALPTLRGKNLACWCPQPAPGEPDKCHAAVLLELANFGGGTKAPGTALN